MGFVTLQIPPDVKQHPPEDIPMHNTLEGKKQHPLGFGGAINPSRGKTYGVHPPEDIILHNPVE